MVTNSMLIASVEKFYGFPNRRGNFRCSVFPFVSCAYFLHSPINGRIFVVRTLRCTAVGILIEKKLPQTRRRHLLFKIRRNRNYRHNNPLYCNSMGNLPFLFNKWDAKIRKNF